MIAAFKVSPPDWTRQRELTFEKVAVLIVRGHKFPLQNNLNKFYQAMGEIEQVVTASAYCQARQKLKPELFLYLNRLVQEGFYRLNEPDGEVKTWHGRRVLGVDASCLNVPDTEATRQRYSVQRNQHRGGERVQAMGSFLYDLLNDVGLNAVLDRKQAEKNFLFSHHLAQTRPGDVVVMDRAHADYAVMATLIQQGRDFVIRFPRSSFNEVNAFWASDQWEQEVELKVSRGQRRFVRQQGLPTVIRVRLIKVRLDTGEIEVLGTSLLDRQVYPSSEFKPLYGWRWQEETYLDRIKNVFEVERFSGQSVLSIEQDFSGVLFLATWESVLSKSAEQELQSLSQPPACQYEKQVNHSVSYSAMLDYLVELLMDRGTSVEQTLDALHRVFKTNPTIRRPGRKVPRKKVTENHKLWFYRYTKRVMA